MDGTEVLDISKDAIYVMLKISAPLLIVALVVGVVIAFFQALTQIQEMTLVFVPRIVALFITLIISLPFISQTINDFAISIFTRIASG